MIVLTTGALALFGATTWLALQQPVARNQVRNRQLTGAGLGLCLITVAGALTAALVTML
ncbi:hypothetical protein ACQP2X_48765 [Actinoplanes sp. CA-131856]